MLALSGSSPFDLNKVLPDVGSDDQYWLGKIMCTTQTCITVQWLDIGMDGVWYVTDLPHVAVDMSTLIAHDVSLGMDNKLRPSLHAQLVAARSAWDCNSPQVCATTLDGCDI